MLVRRQPATGHLGVCTPDWLKMMLFDRKLQVSGLHKELGSFPLFRIFIVFNLFSLFETERYTWKFLCKAFNCMRIFCLVRL